MSFTAFLKVIPFWPGRAHKSLTLSGPFKSSTPPRGIFLSLKRRDTANSHTVMTRTQAKSILASRALRPRSVAAENLGRSSSSSSVPSISPLVLEDCPKSRPRVVVPKVSLCIEASDSVDAILPYFSNSPDHHLLNSGTIDVSLRQTNSNVSTDDVWTYEDLSKSVHFT